MIDIVLRCFSRYRWVSVGTNLGLIDADENPMPGHAIDEIGAAEIAPGVLDTWFWVNVRLYGEAAEADVDTVYPGEEDDTSGFRFVRSKLVRRIRDNSDPATTLVMKSSSIRVYQSGTTTDLGQLIDSRDYCNTPVREWAGGMFY